MFDCITVGVVSAIGGDICVLVLYVAPRLACCLSVGRPVFVIVRVFSGG